MLISISFHNVLHSVFNNYTTIARYKLLDVKEKAFCCVYLEETVNLWCLHVETCEKKGHGTERKEDRQEKLLPKSEAHMTKL